MNGVYRDLIFRKEFIILERNSLVSFFVHVRSYIKQQNNSKLALIFQIPSRHTIKSITTVKGFGHYILFVKIARLTVIADSIVFRLRNSLHYRK